VSNKFYYNDGSVLDFYDNSKILHRVDGPAIEYADGDTSWYVNGKRHRVDGPAVEYANGSKFWWIDGQRHRIDGPAIEWFNGDKYWYIDGKVHRLDGPAYEYADGSEYWYINDIQLSEEQFNNHPKVQHYRFQVLLEEVLSER